MNSNKVNPKIVLTGGGTAGHVMPHLALLPGMQERGWEIHYIGSDGIERTLLEKEGIPFHQIPVGKLRRYLSLENLTDVFRLMGGTLKALIKLKKIRPGLVFSKGGFVSVPVTLAAWILKIPVVTHESDLTPGLANKIIARFARRIIHAFPETARYLPKDKAVPGGIPVRSFLSQGDQQKGALLCGFREDDTRPVILMTGGSLGAQKLNDSLEKILPELTKTCRVIHLTGKGKSLSFKGDGYKGFEFVGEGLEDIFALSDVVIARAGANSIFEFLSLKLPMLLIPLDQGSRGDQIQNAKNFREKGWAIELAEKDLSPESLSTAVEKLFSRKAAMTEAMQKNPLSSDSAGKILDILSGEF